MNPIISLLALILFGVTIAIGWFLFLILRDAITDWINDREYKKEQFVPDKKPNPNLVTLLKKMEANPSSFEIEKVEFKPSGVYYGDLQPTYYVSVGSVGIEVKNIQISIGTKGPKWADNTYIITDGTKYFNDPGVDPIYTWTQEEYNNRLARKAEERTKQYLDQIGLELTMKYLEPEETGKIPVRSKIS